MKVLSQVDWKSPNTYVFFGVQVIGVSWLLSLIWRGVAGSLSVENILISLCMVFFRYKIGMWFITVWRHRYFSHRSFGLGSRFQWMENVAALISSADAQRGVCQWAAEHVWHHRYSDEPEDHHSCKQRGVPWCHWLWVVKKGSDRVVDWSLIPLLGRNQFLRWIENRQWIGIVSCGGMFSLIGGLLSIGGYSSFIWNFIFSLCAYFFATTILWHGTFLINSAMHLVGTQRYSTGDESRNSLICALLTLGEGWHNNHHNAYPSLRSVKEGRNKKVDRSQLYWQGETTFERCFDWSGISIWILIELGIFKSL